MFVPTAGRLPHPKMPWLWLQPALHNRKTHPAHRPCLPKDPADLMHIPDEYGGRNGGERGPQISLFSKACRSAAVNQLHLVSLCS